MFDINKKKYNDDCFCRFLQSILKTYITSHISFLFNKVSDLVMPKRIMATQSDSVIWDIVNCED